MYYALQIVKYNHNILFYNNICCQCWEIRVSAPYYYPDVVVTCSGMDIGPESPQYYLEDPLLIVEVLSPSTEIIDRREKMLGYRSLPGLKEYVLVDSEKQWIEVYGLQNGANWTVDLFTPISPLIL